MALGQRSLIYSTSPWMVLECPKPCFILRQPNDSTSHVAVHGLPEQSLIDWCQQFCRPNGVFVDIGAHAGMYALSLAPHCKTVHAFECQRATYYQLCGGVALNAYWNVHPHHVALSDQDDVHVPVYITSLDGGGTSLQAPPENVPILDQEFTVTSTLDSFQLDQVCFLKLDVEGSEEKVLRGAVQTLERSQYPPFVFESWTDPAHAAQRASLHQYVTDTLGYQLHPLTGYPQMMLAARNV